MMTLQEEWDFTNRHLEWLNAGFVALHKKNQKDWNDLENFIADEYRSGAKSIGEYRYWILERARKEGIKIL